MNKYFSKLNGYFCKDLEAREALNNVYTKTQVDNTLNNYYTKTQVDNSLNNYYTKSQIDNSYYTKSQIDNTLNNYKLKSDYAIISGSITLEANTQEQASNNQFNPTYKEIDYPSGFNSSNCILASFGVKSNDITNAKWNYEDLNSGNLFSLGLVIGNVPKCLIMQDNNIKIYLGNIATSTKSYDYKIVLMKV